MLYNIVIIVAINLLHQTVIYSTFKFTVMFIFLTNMEWFMSRSLSENCNLAVVRLSRFLKPLFLA